MNIVPIAFFHSPMCSKFGIPRQSGLVPDLQGEIVFEKDFSSAEAIRCLDEFEYIWLIWGFSENIGADGKNAGWSNTVRPPRLGGNSPVGVFASRSPFRPNHLGLSSVKIDRISFEDGKTIIGVLGADLMDGTPIYDIKPYIRYCDSHPEAKSGYTDTAQWDELEVFFPENLKKAVGEDLQTITELLRQDPRPKYHTDPCRIYGMTYKNTDIRFSVDGKALTVIEIINC